RQRTSSLASRISPPLSSKSSSRRPHCRAQKPAPALITLCAAKNYLRLRFRRATLSADRQQGGAVMTSQKPAQSCDIVMKGGITSGVVYPLALVELSTKFRFSNIGGTSAGAMAAAAGRPRD